MTDPAASTSPMFRVVRGTPSDTELAALVTILMTRGAASDNSRARRRSVWAGKARLVRPPLRPGPGAWRASALPR